MGKLVDKRILVVGAAEGGTGAATARKLAKEGARVFLGDLNTEGVQKVASEIGADWKPFNLGNPEEVVALVDAAVEHLGGLDGVANIAADLSVATISNDKDLLEMNIELWKHVLNTNLMGYALVIKAALPHLIEAGGGAIVNISSGAAYVGEPTRPAYAASKAGVNTLTRHVASRWGKDNIRCNSISPGAIMSQAAHDNMSEEFKQQLKAGISLTRLGKPEDIANGIAYLLSDEAEWISGQVWTIDGGGNFRE